MAVSPLISATQAILTPLIPLASQQIALAWGWKKELRSLQNRLEIIQALLRDAAQSRQVPLETLQVWLEKLKPVACMAEDVLDEIAYELVRKKCEKLEVRNLFSASNSNPLMPFRLKMANRVKNINLQLDDISKLANGIGLQPVAHVVNAIAEPARVLVKRTLPNVGGSKPVGRGGDLLRVREMVLKDSIVNDSLSVIAIVGMAGLGKTTLAQLVYNDKEVVKKFGEKRMWVCVSDNFEVEWILNHMVESLAREESKLRSVEGLMRKLGEKLNEEKYLLVLDDIWNEDGQEWERLRDALMGIGGAQGSKIIITTRNMSVVPSMQISSLTHPIKELSGEDSWTMFRNIAFAVGGPNETSNLVAIGKAMVEKCKGVPLAIKSLGSLMYSKKHEPEWLSIRENEIWRSPGDETLKALRLSFDHLPSPSLKQCFAFCSMFPKDFVIVKDDLIQLWMSQGYLQPSSERKLEMEDVGSNYFDILLLSSLFQDAKLDGYNNIISCKMHDLVHDLALQVSKGSCLTLKDGKLKDDAKVQHVFLDVHKKTSLEISKQNIGNLRTLLRIDQEDIVGAKRVRALSVRTLPWDNNEIRKFPLPSSISKFIHLKYLDLSMTCIETLPDFVAKLYRLQTLKLPRSLQKFPENFHNLVNLRHLCFVYWEESKKLMPTMIGKLTSLQTLPFFVVGEDKGHEIEQLWNLKNLRGELKIYNLEKARSREAAEKVNLSKISILKLHWIGEREDGINSDGNVLEGLKPHGILKHLKIENFEGKRFATWMRKDRLELENLVKIELINCGKCEQIPTLGHLPYLEAVALVGLCNVKLIGTEFYGDGVFKHDEVDTIGCSSNSNVAVFPALRELIVKDMPKLEEWSDVSPGLRKLIARGMPNLEEWSDVSCPNLKKLQILDCPGLISIPSYFLSIQRLSIFLTCSRSFEDGGTGHGDPFLAINLDQSSNINAFLEDLFQKVSKYVRKLRITSLGQEGFCYLPNNFQNLMSLEELSIRCCPTLTFLAKGLPQTLVRLIIIDCHNLTCITKETEEEFSSLTSLQCLLIRDCKKLTCLLPKGLPQTLEQIEIRGCPSLTVGNPDALGNLTSLQSLEVVDCPRLETCWNDRIVCLRSLRHMKIGHFSKELEYFPWPSSSISAATSSEVIGTHVQQPQQYPFTSLESLELQGRPNVKSLPYQLWHLNTALKKLHIYEFHGLEVLPEWLGNLTTLQSLRIHELGKLEVLPECLGNLTSLQCLSIWRCKNLKKLPSLEAMQRLVNLRSLLMGCFSEELECFPWPFSSIGAATSSEVINTQVQQTQQ